MIIAHYHQYLEEVIAIAMSAGRAIMQVYATDFTVENKADNSPLTQADLSANQVIVSALSLLTPTTPVLSEESATVDFEARKRWQQYWLIDPLDGTREFVKRNGEFTVNIALIDCGRPVLGVVYAPVTGLLYFATHKYGAYKQLGIESALPIHTKILNLNQPVLAISRSHTEQLTHSFIQHLEAACNNPAELIPMGSSLKICMVAEGLADVYPRLGPTSEWDTGAAHCILQEAGGDIVDTFGETLRYNAKSSLLNPFFFAQGEPDFNWAQFLEPILTNAN
jgi:3'(2'), 5'-bisphosphate nucleotidase